MSETTETTHTEDPHLKDGWRPIATAPKNGARIWLFAPHIVASAMAMHGHAACYTGIDAGRWFEDEDFGCRCAGWTSPQFGWKEDGSEIMATNQDCYLYWKPITRAEELELAAIEGWKACMRDVKETARELQQARRLDLSTVLKEIYGLTPGFSEELDAVKVELNAQAKLIIFQFELDALTADMDRGFISIEQLVAEQFPDRPGIAQNQVTSIRQTDDGGVVLEVAGGDPVTIRMPENPVFEENVALKAELSRIRQVARDLQIELLHLDMDVNSVERSVDGILEIADKALAVNDFRKG